MTEAQLKQAELAACEGAIFQLDAFASDDSLHSQFQLAELVKTVALAAPRDSQLELIQLLRDGMVSRIARLKAETESL